jgi:aspartate racemase
MPMHKVADDVQVAIVIPLLHIADITAAAVRRAGLRHVSLLATAYTTEQSFYRERLEGHGLEITVPDAADRATVHRIIYDELCQGIIRDDSRQQYRDIIGRLVGSRAEGVILGCTEIERLISAVDVAMPVFPTTRLHAEAAVAYVLGSSSATT